jgi:signal peptidase I
MYPTFRYGDFVRIIPAAISNLRPGDVIVFRGNSPDRLIVHRVLRVISNGVITKGDANCSIDPEIVTKEKLLGCVRWFERRGKSFRTVGGCLGLLWAILLWQLIAIYFVFCSLGAIAYRMLARSSAARRLARMFWHPQFKVVCVRNNGSCALKLHIGKRVVAEFEPRTETPRIRPPYGLVFDPKDLKRHVQAFLNEQRKREESYPPNVEQEINDASGKNV